MNLNDNHQRYLREHETEYPFPLNGSDWARLVALHKFLDHHEHCNCNGCDDFYQMIHANGLKEHEREATRRALRYWLWLGQVNGCQSSEYTPQKTSKEKAWDLLATLSSDPDLLAQTEKKWLEQKQKMFEHDKQVSESETDSPFWDESKSEMWESRPVTKPIGICKGECDEGSSTGSTKQK